jgi:hypothetical protein
VDVGRGCCQWAHRTVRCATRHCPVRQPRHPTVRVRPLEIWQVGPPDSHCALFGAPSAPALTLRSLSTHCSVHCSLLETTVGAVAVTPHGTPDSPVNYSGVAFSETRSWAVQSCSPWCTGHCPVAHRTVHCARPGYPSIDFAPFYLNPFLDFILVCVEPLVPVELII